MDIRAGIKITLSQVGELLKEGYVYTETCNIVLDKDDLFDRGKIYRSEADESAS